MTYEPLTAGVARKDVSPPVGIALQLWGAGGHKAARGVDLPLEVTALHLARGEARLLLAAVDALSIETARSLAIRDRIAAATGIPQEHVLLCCSHTHSAPHPTHADDPGPGKELIDPYLEFLDGAIVHAAVEAAAGRDPIRVKSATGRCDVNVHRRYSHEGKIVCGKNPAGVNDPTLVVARIDRLNGRPLAALVNFACHPTINAHLNDLVTPEFPGPLRQVVEEELHCPVLFLQGATGDLTAHESYTGDITAYRRVGRRLGHAASELLLGIDTLPREHRFREVLESGAPLAIWDYVAIDEPEPQFALRDLTVTLQPNDRLPSAAKLQQRVADAKSAWADAQQSGDQAALKEASWKLRRSSILLRVRQRLAEPHALDLPLCLVRLGDLRLAFAPHEFFNAFARGIRSEVDDRVAVVCYTNESNTYIPDAPAYDQGGYEVSMARFQAGSLESVRDAAVEQLRAV